MTPCWRRHYLGLQLGDVRRRRLPYDDNLERTARAVRQGHAAGLWVEAELGYVGGKPDAPQSAHADGVRTDPDEAADFVQRTGVDALAVAVGSSRMRWPTRRPVSTRT